MKSKELLPFDRNRYYKGKMLTSSDFEAEQLYVNNKRRFINQNINGSGIICGLGVTSLDDLSIMIESGAALDSVGREIVLENSVVKKLSTIKGFEELAGDKAILGIRYSQKETQPTYAINQKEGGEEYENNRIEEEAEVFLIDSGLDMDAFGMETEFFTGGVLYDDDDFTVSIKLPSYLCADTFVKIDIEVLKKSEAAKALYFETELTSPAISAPDGNRDIKVLIENLNLGMGQKKVVSVWGNVTDEAIGDTTLMIKAGSGKVLIDGKETVISAFNTRMVVIDEEPSNLAARECGKVNLEFRSVSAMTDYIKLAEVKLIRTDSAYIIDSIKEDGVKNYIRTLRDHNARSEFESYFVTKYPFIKSSSDNGSFTGTGKVAALAASGNTRIETGIVEVALGGKAKRGDICYSGEIMHGLGKGNVYVELGYEALEFDQRIKQDTKTVVYGNPSLFRTETSPVNVETAVKVFNDKGSFMVAVKLLDDVEYLVLTYRYIAIKSELDAELDELESISDKSITAVTPTVVLGSKETYYFQVQFNNMKATSVSYEVTEPGSGDITPDGVYTAPAREGVYEIRIYCTEKPAICTYAYAIVKKNVNNTPETQE